MDEQTDIKCLSPVGYYTNECNFIIHNQGENFVIPRGVEDKEYLQVFQVGDFWVRPPTCSQETEEKLIRQGKLGHVPRSTDF